MTKSARSVRILLTASLILLSIGVAIADQRAVPADGNTYCVVQGDCAILSGAYTGNDIDLMVDHRLTTIAGVFNGTSSYTVSWPASRTGEHLLQTVTARPDGTLLLDHAYHIRVLAYNPLVVTGAPDTTTQNVQLHITLAQSADFQPSTVTITDQNGNPIILGALPGDVTIPLENAPAGDYTYTITAKDSSGATYLGESFHITVPERVQLNVAPAFTLSRKGDECPLSVSLASDLKIGSIDYTVDGKSVATSTTAPYSASVDMSGFHTGEHTLAAILTDSDGNRFQSPSISLEYTNQVEDNEIAAQQEAAAQALEQAQAEAAAAKAKQEAQLKDNGNYAVANKYVTATFDNIEKQGDTAQEYPHWEVWVDLNNGYSKDISVSGLGQLTFDDYSTVSVLLDGLDQDATETVVPAGGHVRLAFEGDDDDVANHTKKPTHIEITVGSTPVRVPMNPPN